MASEIQPPITESGAKKSPFWHQRNSYIIRGATPPSEWIQDGQVRATQIKPQWEEVVPGENGLPFVRCKTFEYKGVDSAAEDGAEVAIVAGKNTPVQYVASETTFSEIPLRGKLLFLSVSPEGEFGSYLFDVASKDDSRYMAQVSKGWIMSWYALTGQREDALVLETERPGFSASDLPTVDNYAKSIGNTKIPEEFWETLDLLKNGQEELVISKAKIITSQKAA